ncbi:MAG: HDOD domain-containing protein [Rhodocyclaceae bacterium]|nr:HDOD domain-containing protein [Rhodocyclaceae bacterium]
MLGKLRKLFGGASPPAAPAEAPSDFERLNQVAPLKAKAPSSDGDRRSFVCREAILDRQEKIAGYEFSLTERLQSRLSQKSQLLHRVYDDALLRNLVQHDLQNLLGNRIAFVHLSPASLLNPLIDGLSPANTVLVLDSGDTPELPTELAGVLARQRQRGLRIGWLLRSPQATIPLHVADADMFQIDALAFDGLQIRSVMRDLSGMRTAGLPKAAFIARNLLTFDDFNLCFNGGFDYFQGPFVTSRENWRAPKSDVDRLHFITLLNLVRQGAEYDVIADHMRQEPVMTFKLLRYLNSPLLGLQQKITSVSQALLIIGRDKFYRWLSLLLFSVRDQGYRERILAEQALTRGRFLESLAGQGGIPPVANDLFLLGLFSLLDVLLGLPLAEIVARVQLPEPVRDALLGQASAWRDALDLAMAYESGDEARLGEAAARCGVDAGRVTGAALEALGWTREITSMQESEAG